MRERVATIATKSLYGTLLQGCSTALIDTYEVKIIDTYATHIAPTAEQLIVALVARHTPYKTALDKRPIALGQGVATQPQLHPLVNPMPAIVSLVGLDPALSDTIAIARSWQATNNDNHIARHIVGHRGVWRTLYRGSIAQEGDCQGAIDQAQRGAHDKSHNACENNTAKDSPERHRIAIGNHDTEGEAKGYNKHRHQP